MQQRVFAALFLAGCTLGSRRDAVARFNPEDAARKLQQIQAAAQSDPSLLARAGWLRYLIASDPKGAVPKLEAAARSGTPADRALALAGLGEIAEDRTDSRSRSLPRCACSIWKGNRHRSTSSSPERPARCGPRWRRGLRDSCGKPRRGSRRGARR